MPTTEWVTPTEFPDLRKAEEIAIDLETRDPELKKLGSGAIKGSGEVVGIAVAVDGEAIVTLTGSGTVGTSAIGTATTVSNNNLSVTLNAVTGSLGSITTDAEANVFPTGVSAAAETGVILVWGEVDDSQTISWETISDAQTPGWEEVA